MHKFRGGYKLLNSSIHFGRTKVAKLMTAINFISIIPENFKDPFSYSHQIPLFYSTRSLIYSDPNAPLTKSVTVCDDSVGKDDDDIQNGQLGIKDEIFKHDVMGSVSNYSHGDINEDDDIRIGQLGIRDEKLNCDVKVSFSNKDDDDVQIGQLGIRDEKLNCDVDFGVSNDSHGIDGNEDDDFSREDDDEIENGQLGIKDDKLNYDIEVILEILRGVGNKGDPSEVKPRLKTGAQVVNKLNQCGIALSSELVVAVLSRTRNNWEVAFMFFLWAGKHPGYAHSVREYHSMISILAKRRKFDTAWSLIDKMRKVKIVNPNTLLIMIRRYCAVHDVVSALNTFHAFKRFDFHLGVEEFQQLLSALARYKNVQDAEHLLFSNKNTFPFETKSFNIILNGWCNVSPRETNRFWRLMIDQGIKPDVVSYSSIISSYSKSNRLKEVLRLFDKMKEMNIYPDRKVYNAVIHALAKGGRLEEALNLLRTMEDKKVIPNAVTYNSLIKPLCKARKREEAQKVFDDMLRNGLQPNCRTCHAFLHILRTEEEINMFLDKMKELGCHPNKDTYLLLIRKFCRWGQLDNVFKLWDIMTENGWNDDEASYIALIHGLFLNGKLEEAHKAYSDMKEKSLLPDAKTDELIQTWLSNKKMAESQSINSRENQNSDKL